VYRQARRGARALKCCLSVPTTLEHTGGVLLSPAVVLHAGMTLALARAGLARDSRG
jgi:hypothetical protein